MIYDDASERRLRSILIMTSKEDSAPEVAYNAEEWDIQSYSGWESYPAYKSEVFDAGGITRHVKGRHVAVYNNGTSGITLAEFEVFGAGMHSPDNVICHNNY